MKRLLAASVSLVVLCASLALASSNPPVSALGPDQALERLQRGNERYVAGKPIHPNADAMRRMVTTKEGQKPYATVLACSDSRVPPEIFFDTGVGELFVVRVAGNVAYFDQVGSIEYAAEHLGTPLLVVLGHTHCGAVTAVAEDAHVAGNIAPMVAGIKPAVAKAKADNPGLSGAALTAKAIEANTWQSIEDVFKQSPEMRLLVREGKVKVVGALYDIESGKVSWLGEHPRQAELLQLNSGLK